jgi:hypothetical protein
MPELPSGLTFYISRDALFDHGGNWFKCPDGHFWYWVAAPEMGAPPYALNGEVSLKAEHAPVPRSRDEMKKFIRVLQKRPDGMAAWGGEWLADFPRYTEMGERDLAAWRTWLAEDKVDRFLDEAIAECERLAEVSRHATGYAVLEDGKEGRTSDGRDLRLNAGASTISAQKKNLQDIQMHEPSEEFGCAWHAAGHHIQTQSQGSLRSWLKVDLNPPFLEHLSFRLGNQLFFIRIEDVDGHMQGPGNLQGLLSISDGCKGHACIMPMRKVGPRWIPDVPGWGLIDARTGLLLDPPSHITSERIEITDWELHDFAVQVVRGTLQEQGRQLMSWQGNPNVNPSVWFVGDSGPEWVVVRAVRYPEIEALPPSNMDGIAEHCAAVGKLGHFASVSFSSNDELYDPAFIGMPGFGMPLWRGHRCQARFEGLVPWRKN